MVCSNWSHRTGCELIRVSYRCTGKRGLQTVIQIANALLSYKDQFVKTPRWGGGSKSPLLIGVKNLQGWGEIPSNIILSHTENISRKPDLNKVIFNC
jgi:hypothetical protein